MLLWGSILLAAFLLTMALGVAPTPSSRTIPTGYKMPEGFKALIVFSFNPAVNIWEIDVKPPGVESGEPINTTTQLNLVWRTMSAPQLKTFGPTLTVKFAYDPGVMASDLQAQVGNNYNTCTVIFPTNEKVAFYAVITKIEFDPLKEKEFPTGTMTIVPTMWDASHQVEQGPVWVGSGTG
jgi:hypothetical protein